ncbi:MAG: pyruvate synthase subunit PorA [Desulfobacteraceae bacterium]
MSTATLSGTGVKLLTGNAAAAFGAMLCSPDVVAAYPITPQTEVIEKLSQFHAEGDLDAEMINVEGENSAMNAVTAASLAGGRVFTATSSWGLVFMYDAVLATAGARAPVVMVNVNRETPGIIAVSSGQQDMISTRDCGWIFLVAENCQEILDQVIIAYRLAEDHGIQLPVMVHYDGFYLSYMAERVEVPEKRMVKSYLSILDSQPRRPALLPGKGLGCGSHGIMGGYLELRRKHLNALMRSKEILKEAEDEFARIFQRSYPGAVEEYRAADADTVLVGSGSMCGTIRTVVDVMRDQGRRVGMVKIRMYRPFPAAELVSSLKGKKSAGVVDRSVCFGFEGGPIFNEVASLSGKFPETGLLSFIDGIANTDITKENIEEMFTRLIEMSKGGAVDTVNWMAEE